MGAFDAICLDDGIVGKAINRLAAYEDSIDDVTWELVEVIGNIYENPELLEG